VHDVENRRRRAEEIEDLPREVGRRDDPQVEDAGQRNPDDLCPKGASTRAEPGYVALWRRSLQL
jgi:hypothetical protein